MDSDTELEQPQGGNPGSRQKKGLSKKTLVILISVVVVLIIALGALAYKNSQDKNGATPTVAVSPVPSLVQTATQERIEEEGVTWLTPEKIEDQGLFEKSGVDSFYSSTDYYKVGKTSTGGEILLAVINIDEPRNDQPIHRILKNSDSYKRIVQNSADFSNDGYQPTKKLVNENSYVFKSLLADKVITKNQTDLTSLQNPVFYYENKSETVEKKIASTKWGDMYLELGRSYSANDIDQQNQDKTTVLKIARYFVKLNDSTQLSYEVRPRFLRDDNTFDLDYKINKVSSYKYDKFETGGCGFGLGSFPYMTETESLKNNDIVGTKSSASLYGVSNTDNKTLSYAYTLYKSDQASGKVSLDEFASNYGFVYWTDDYGNTVGYLRSDYKPAIECGKPVVYLYPNKKTDFTVKVGAYVTKSDPMYDGFWQGTAYPGSKLVVSNKEYSSLFWEGIGYGLYPKIDFGKYVDSNQVKEEIIKDLRRMHLNDQEIADFLAFWLEKMPKTKYTRMSWLTNDQLDELAPLAVLPKPDSVIRVFLDFSGSDKKYAIKPQILPEFSRRGFTVVEWGGLLKGN